MNPINRRTLLGISAASVVGLVPTLVVGQQTKAQPGQPLNITVTSAPSAPDVSLVLGSRNSKVTPVRSGTTHTGGGNIDVQQPSPDTIIITMTGVAVAYGGPCTSASASQVFELVQQLEVSFDKPIVKAAKLTIEGKLIGFLRSHKLGVAEVCASAIVQSGNDSKIVLTMPSHSVSGKESISINDKEAPGGVVVGAGKLSLYQSFKVTASMPKSVLPCKAPSAEFAPDPALDPLWISSREPFKGANKKDLGFQITIRVTPEALSEKK